MAAAAILDFQKFEILTVDPLYEANMRQSLYQISSKSVKRLQRYSDLTVIKMLAVCHVEFLKFEIFNGRSG